MKNLKLHTEILKHKLKYMFIISKIIYINPSDNSIEKVILNQIHQDENIDKNYIQNPYSENFSDKNSISQNDSIINFNQNIQNPNTNKNKITNYTNSITVEYLPSSILDSNQNIKNPVNNINLNYSKNNEFKSLNHNKYNEFKNYNNLNNNTINYNEDYYDEYNKDVNNESNDKKYNESIIKKIEQKGEEIYEKQKNLNNQEKKRLDEFIKIFYEPKQQRRTKEEIENSKKNEEENKKQKNTFTRITWKSKEKKFDKKDKVHTKYKADNIIKKINSLVLNIALTNFINKKIKENPKPTEDAVIYEDQNKIYTLRESDEKIEIKKCKSDANYDTKIIEHKLNPINAQFIENSSTKYNIGLINLTIKDILSLPTSGKYKYDKFSNKIIIDNLIRSFPEKYKELFDIKYLEVIKYYANTSKDKKINKLLKGMEKFKEKPKDEYTKRVKQLMSYYDIFFYSRKNRPSKEEKNKISQLDINDEINISNLDDEKLYFTAIDYKISTEKNNEKNNENNNTLINKKRKNSSSSQND